MSELPAVTPEFLNSQLDKTIQFPEKFLSKKGGPYSKLDRMKRRTEVFKLHFEEGISSIKIAEMLKVNRHTVSRDINFGYKELSNLWDQDITSLILKQVYRLELQRNRLLKQLKNHTIFQESILLEKMIFEIDSRIAHMITKGVDTQDHILNIVTKYLDKLNKEPDQRQVWINNQVYSKVSQKTQKKIREIITEDLQDPENYLEENEDEENLEENEIEE